MPNELTGREAQVALDAIAQRRREVIAEINVPRWYWWGLALGWIVLGLITVVGKPWLSVAATVAFGAIHAAIAPRVIDGRHGSGRLSVRADVVSRHVSALVIGFLLVLVALTIGVALVADALGASSPVLIASVVVAVVVLVGGPHLIAAVRRRAERSVAS